MNAPVSAPPPASYGLTPIAEAVRESGLAFLSGMLEGRHPAPPISRTMNFWAAEVREGEVVFVGDPQPDCFNPLGTIHGGWTAAILDSAMACAVHATLKAGEAYTTAQMSLNYVRPIMPGTGLLRCVGRVVSRGRTLATSEGQLFDARGRLMAHGTETCAIFPFNPDKGAPA
jgi:uncharacterized protein (TIGR00369 family)